MEKMKAALTTKYGPPEVLRIQEVDRPIPRSHEMLIKIQAIAVTSGDCRLRAFRPPSRSMGVLMRLMIGIRKPRKPIQGLWLAGVIVEAGDKVQRYKAGEAIYARTMDLKFGANAEYICLPDTAVMGLKPKGLSFEEAVSIPFGGLTAMHFLEKARLMKGDRLLVYGASGAVGTSAVQLGNYYGAEVTAVCSTDNVDWVANLGAKRTIDYKQEDITAGDDRFDIVFDAVGYLDRASVNRILQPKGRFISVIHSGHARLVTNGLNVLTELAEQRLFKPVIDRCYRFDEIIEAHRYVETGRKRGNVVIKVP